MSGGEPERISEPSASEPTARPGREAVAIGLWWATIVTLFAAALVWMNPPRAGRHVDGGGSDGNPEPTTGPDIRSLVISPPIAGQPTREKLDLVIRKGCDAFLHLYVEPALANAEPGGFLDYVDANGVKKRLGPNVYVQCQLYLIIHLLLFCDELGIPRDEPLVKRSLAFLVKNFDDEKGRWLWSAEGCLHAKGLSALALFGERERFEKGWRYALASPMYKTDERLFTMMQSGAIIQTLGPAMRSLSGEDAWEHGAPIVDEENTSKFIYALLEAGRRPSDPEVAELDASLSRYLAATPLAIGYMKTKDVIGRVWEVILHARWRLPESEGFRLTLAELRACVKGEWRLNFMLRLMPNFRADVVRAVIEIGDRGDEIDALMNGLVETQEPDGAWRLPQVKPMWGLDVPPKQGYKFGNMDGANTYMITLALATYRRATYGTK